MKRKSATTTSRENPKLLLAKAISQLSAKQDAFVKAVETMEELKKDEIIKYDLEIEAKQHELDELEEKFKHQIKNKQIETDQLLAEYSYEGALKILKERQEIPIGSDEYQHMKEELNHLKSDIKNQIESAIAIEKVESKRAISAAISNSDLKHKAETAVLTATVDQQKKEIETLQKAIDKLNDEIAAQRELTKSVAQAARAAPITQQIGK
jgi:HAMP domain-containing protein